MPSPARMPGDTGRPSTAAPEWCPRPVARPRVGAPGQLGGGARRALDDIADAGNGRGRVRPEPCSGKVDLFFSVNDRPGAPRAASPQRRRLPSASPARRRARPPPAGVGVQQIGSVTGVGHGLNPRTQRPLAALGVFRRRIGALRDHFCRPEPPPRAARRLVTHGAGAAPPPGSVRGPPRISCRDRGSISAVDWRPSWRGRRF